MTGRDRLRQRREAARLFAAGATRAAVARRLGVARSTAGRWFRAWQKTGARGFERARPPGRRPRLGPTDRDAVRNALQRPPRAHGFPLDRWTLASVAALVERVTGVRFHRRHVGRLLRSLGWVIPPVGRHAQHAFRRETIADAEGNPISLFGR